MVTKKLNVSVLVQNTHHNNMAAYYGPPRAGMVAGPPVPNNIAFIRDCVTTAQAGHQAGAVATICMLPEFILQPQEGAYTSAQRGIVQTHLQAILNNTPNNVLVVFGTIVSESPADGNFYNDMLYGIGGGALQHTGKLHLSPIDLIDAAVAMGGNLIGWDGGGILKKTPIWLAPTTGPSLQVPTTPSISKAKE